MRRILRSDSDITSRQKKKRFLREARLALAPDDSVHDQASGLGWPVLILPYIEESKVSEDSLSIGHHEKDEPGAGRLFLGNGRNQSACGCKCIFVPADGN